MKNRKRVLWALLLVGLLASYFYAQVSQDDIVNSAGVKQSVDLSTEVHKNLVDNKTVNFSEDKKRYSSKNEVTNYLMKNGKLPANFLTKSEAKKLGWKAEEGNLWEVAPGMSIGGDRFFNREKILPSREERKYFECDIDYEGGFRNAKRIIYSNDGWIYYTGDHYRSFELILEGQ